MLAHLGDKVRWTYGDLARAWAAGDRRLFFDKFRAEPEGGMTIGDARRFADRLRAEPDRGCLYFAGQVTAVNLMAQRPQPTRFYYFPTITRLTASMPMASRWTQLWAADLSRVDCLYILVSEKKNAEWLGGSSPAAAELRSLLQQYRPVGTLGRDASVVIYRRLGR